MKKINEDYDKLSTCDDIDVSDIVGTLMDSLPSDYNGNVRNLLKVLNQLWIAGEMQSKSQGEAGSGLKAENLELESGVQIGSVIEILPICDNKKTYLTLLHFDR